MEDLLETKNRALWLVVAIASIAGGIAAFFGKIISAVKSGLGVIIIFISLACVGCISSTVRKPDGTTHHFGSIAQNVQRLEYHADGSFVAEGVDSATPTREVVKTAGLISIGKTLTSGVLDVAGDAVEKIE